MRVFLITLIFAGLSSICLATAVIRPVERIALGEADRFGVSVRTERVADIVFVSFSVSNQFPCQLDSVSVATFEGSVAILAARIESRDGIYQIQTLERFLEHTRVDLDCVPDSASPAMYILEFSELMEDA